MMHGQRNIKLQFWMWNSAYVGVYQLLHYSFTREW